MAAPATGIPVGSAPAAPASSNPVVVIATRLKEYSAGVLKQGKPWSELTDRNAFSKPANLGEAATRLRKNAAYFKINYMVVMLLTTVVTFVMHPSSLLVLGVLVAAWAYLFMIRTTPLKYGDRTISEREKLIGMSAVTFITIFFLTSVGTVFFSAISVGLALIAAHGAFREPDNLFVDDVAETTNPNASLLGIFTVPAAPATGAAAV